MRKVSLALSLLALSSVSFADTTKPFEGWYLGGNFGYGSGTNHDVSVIPGQSGPSGTPRDIDGTFGGIQGGYNWQLDNNIVLGVETGLTSYNISGGTTRPESGSDWNDGYDIKQGFNLNFKTGYAIGNWLPYVTAGLTVASMDYMKGCSQDPTNYYNDCPAPFESTSEDTRVGYNVGVGVEWKFSDSFSTALEYRYTDLGESDAYISTNSNVASESYSRFKTDFEEVTLRVNYYF